MSSSPPSCTRISVPDTHAGLPSMPLFSSPPSPAPTCYTLSITGQHQSTPGAYTPDYCRYRFLNRKIYTLNIAVNTGKSIGMRELLGLRAPWTVYTCSLNAVPDQACFKWKSAHKINYFFFCYHHLTLSFSLSQPYCQEMCAAHQSGIFLIMKNVSSSVVDNQVLLSFSLRFTYDR